jgi:outer membrane biosynthesis protein TonB
MAAARTRRSPALAASILAHVGLVAAALFVFPHTSRPFKLGESVPVTIVASGPPEELAPAVQAPEPAPASTPEPQPQAPAQPAPLSPAPPTPAPAKAQPKPNLTPTPAKPSDANFLDTLAASISSASRPTTQASAGQRGPARPRTAETAQQGKGQDEHVSASELGELKAKLIKLWNPNCQVEGARQVNVPIRIRLTPDGRLAAPPQDVDNLRSSGNPVVAAAAERAISAVGRGAPYTELNPDHYQDWHDIQFNFKGSEACR